MSRLKELRQKADITQEELAEMCDVKRITITMIELGKNQPSFSLAVKIAKALNCKMEDLI